MDSFEFVVKLVGVLFAVTVILVGIISLILWGLSLL